MAPTPLYMTAPAANRCLPGSGATGSCRALPGTGSGRSGGASAGAGAGAGKAVGLGNAVPTQHSFARRHQVASPGGGSGSSGGSGGSSSGGGGGSGTCSTRGMVLYSAALEYARLEHYERARRVFQATVRECPSFHKPWVSWAQMEKRCIPKGDERRWHNCRSVLQRGLCVNPNAPSLLQAWGLMEMQRGNWVAALLLLDRAVRFEPRNSPVLRWKPVVEARQTVGSRRAAHETPAGSSSSSSI